MATCPECHQPMLTEWPHAHRRGEYAAAVAIAVLGCLWWGMAWWPEMQTITVSRAKFYPVAPGRTTPVEEQP